MSSPADFAPCPPSEIEWEELLSRYEAGPRALRIAVENGTRAAGTSDLGLAPLIFGVVDNEYWTEVLFCAMHTGTPADPARVPQWDAIPGDPFYLLDFLTTLRAANHAMVQRHGPEVWDWRTDSGVSEVTAHQQIQYSVALDGETVAAIRAAAEGASR